MLRLCKIRSGMGQKIRDQNRQRNPDNHRNPHRMKNPTCAEALLASIMIRLNRAKMTFSKTQSAVIVGGRARLYRLIEQGKIRVEKPTAKQNGKWFCVASDVLKHVKI